MARTKFGLRKNKYIKFAPQLRPAQKKTQKQKKINAFEKYIDSICDEEEENLPYYPTQEELTFLNEMSDFFVESLSLDHFLQGDDVENDAGLSLVGIGDDSFAVFNFI